MTRVAAYDCGTNSLRLLVADVDPDAGTLVDVVRDMRIVRLGEGVDRTGRLAPQALERTFAVAGEYAERCRELGVEAVRFVATSASRDAENRDEFVEALRLLVADHRLRAAMGRNGRSYVRRNYRWDVIISKYERMFAKLRAR